MPKFDFPNYLQVCEHVSQAELAEVILVEHLEILAPIFSTVLIFEGGTGAEHDLNPGQLEVDVRQVSGEHILVVDLIDFFKMCLNQVSEVCDIAIILFIQRFIYPCKHFTGSSFSFLSLDCL